MGSYAVEANVIDLAILPDRGSIVFSMDMIHCSFSTTVTVSEVDQYTRAAVGAIKVSADGLWFEEDLEMYAKLAPAMAHCASSHPSVEQKGVAKGKSLRELLYGLESLRKRGGEDWLDS